MRKSFIIVILVMVFTLFWILINFINMAFISYKISDMISNQTLMNNIIVPDKRSLEFVFVIPIIFLGISVFWWYKYKKEEQAIKTEDFYPPEGLNSLDVGILYKEKIDVQDVISLLIYLANKGYIKIEEYDEKTLFTKSKGFKITKLKKYDGNNHKEQVFLNNLFFNKKNEVTSFDLYNNFHLTMNQILDDVNSKDKIFDKNITSKINLIKLMIIVTCILITILLMDFPIGKLLWHFSIFLIFPIAFTLMFSMLVGDRQLVVVEGKNANSKIIGLIIGFFGGIFWCSNVLPILVEDPKYLITYMVGLGCILGMIFVLKYLPKKDMDEAEVLRKLQGFKKFLEIAEKEKLEAIIKNNPTYFYDMLPYAYVLGLLDKWFKKFEKISLQAPNWYNSHGKFDMVAFEIFVNNTMEVASKVMS